jgi:hypothetical protein
MVTKLMHVESGYQSCPVCKFCWSKSFTNHCTEYCAFSDLDEILQEQTSTSEPWKFISDDGKRTSITRSHDGNTRSILGAMLSDTYDGPRQYSTVTLLHQAKNVDAEIRHRAIWMSLLKGTCAHPLDAVLSTMHLLGVTLNLEEFVNKPNARLRATIKLMQNYLLAGGRAYWLIIPIHCNAIIYHDPKVNYWLSLDRRMCTIPFYPEAEHQDLPETKDILRDANLVWDYALVKAPHGILDKYGYLITELDCSEFDRESRFGTATLHRLTNNVCRSLSPRLVVVGLGPFSRMENLSGADRSGALVLDSLGVLDGLERWHIVTRITGHKSDLEGKMSSKKSFAIGGPDQWWMG